MGELCPHEGKSAAYKAPRRRKALRKTQPAIKLPRSAPPRASNANPNGVFRTVQLVPVIRPAFLLGGGACADLIFAKDWGGTLLGSIETWSPSLKTAIAILLHSPVPIAMLWGPDGVMLYNDAYSAFAGARHPSLLGSIVREGWPEVADFNHNVMRVGLAGGTLHYRDQELTLHRTGQPEQVWVDLDYSPVLGEDGEPAGVICFLAETTERVAAEKRTAFLLSLSDVLRPLQTPADIMSLAAVRD